MKTPYEKGRDAEYAVKRKLDSMEYRWQIRSAASHTPVDLLVSNGSEVLAVQVKGGASPYVLSAAKAELIQWARKFHAEAVLAAKKRGRWLLKSVQEY